MKIHAPVRRRMMGALAVAALVGGAVQAPAQAAGDGFRKVGSPFLWPSFFYDHIAAAAPDSVWFVGVQGGFCLNIGDFCTVGSDGNPVIRRWDGSRWLTYDAEGLKGGTGDVTWVSAAASGDVWIAQRNYPSGGYVGRLDGTAFRKVALPADSSGVRTVEASAQAGGWLVGGNGNVYRFTGSGWAQASPGFEGYTVKGDWAIGGGVAHWDGAAWQPLPASPAGWVTDIAVVNAADVWVMSSQRQIFHWDGAAWSAVAVPAGDTPVCLTADGQGQVWLGTDKGILRRSGDAWTGITATGTWSTSYTLGITAVPGTGVVWAMSTTNAPGFLTNG